MAGWRRLGPLLALGVAAAQSPAGASPEHLVWEVISGPCDRNGDCITSPNFPDDYGNEEECNISILLDDGLNIKCESFDTERSYDILYIDEQFQHSGSGCNDFSKTVTKSITWTSDLLITHKGWRVCSQLEVGVIDATSSGSTFTFDPLQWSRMVGADDWRSSNDSSYFVTQSRSGVLEWTGYVSVWQTAQGRHDRVAEGERSEGPSGGQWQRGDVIVMATITTTFTTTTTTPPHFFPKCSTNPECELHSNSYCTRSYAQIPECFTEEEIMFAAGRPLTEVNGTPTYGCRCYTEEEIMAAYGCPFTEEEIVAKLTPRITQEIMENLTQSHDCQDGVMEPSTITFILDHEVPFVSTLAVFLIVLLLHIFQFLWRQAQQRRSQRMEAMTTAHSLGVALGRRFIPSKSVNAHQFRGMRPAGFSVSIQFEELGLRLKDNRSVLEGVTGEFQSCHLVAIMGPSGAGKTTFMNVLAGRATYGKRTGKVFFNGAEVNPTSLRPTFGFVPQDDIVHPRLTVRENLHFAAQLRNPSDTPSAAIDDIVDDALKVLQISHIQSSLVGSVEERGISGGQRKRVSIGLELVACPALVYLDEPTSGLDSTTSLQIINSLRKMTELEMTIIMVIHQPRYQLFTLFDDVLLLGPGGRTVFLGPSQSAKPYFEDLGFEMPECENPADWFMDVLSGGVSHPSIELFKPAMLFDMWKERVGSIGQDSVRRLVTAMEDYMISESALKEEWAKVDVDQSGYLDKSELILLLKRCGVTSPDDKGVDDLMGHISADRERVLFQDLVGYVVGMSSAIAVDKDILDRPPALRPPILPLPPESAVTQAERQGEDADADDALLPSLASGADGTGAGIFASCFFCSARHQQGKPGACRQFLTLVVRRFVQWFRESRQRLTDLVLISGCAVVVGLLHRSVHANSVELAVKIATFHMGLALLISVSCLKVFGDDRAIFWRESGGGMNVLSYTLAKMIGNVPDLLLQCALYTCIYFVVSMPRIQYAHYWWPCVLLTLAAASWGYFLSSVLPPENSMTAVVIIVLIFCGVLGNPTKIPARLQGGVMEVVLLFSMSRWSTPMTFVAEMKHALWDGNCVSQLLERQMNGYGNATMKIFDSNDCSWDGGTSASDHAGCVWEDVELNGRYALLLMAFALHVGCYLGLRFTNRDKQV